MSGFTNVVLVGNVTRDPESKQVGQHSVCEFGLACGGKRKGQDERLFVDLAIWGKQGETAQQYVKKGKKLCVSGRLKFSEWEKNGVKFSKLSVIGDSFTFLDSPREASTDTAYTRQPNFDAPGGKKSAAPSGGQPQREPGDIDTQDIPFKWQQPMRRQGL